MRPETADFLKINFPLITLGKEFKPFSLKKVSKEIEEGLKASQKAIDYWSEERASIKLRLYVIPESDDPGPVPKLSDFGGNEYAYTQADREYLELLETKLKYRKKNVERLNEYENAKNHANQELAYAVSLNEHWKREEEKIHADNQVNLNNYQIQKQSFEAHCNNLILQLDEVGSPWPGFLDCYQKENLDGKMKMLKHVLAFFKLETRKTYDPRKDPNGEIFNKDFVDVLNLAKDVFEVILLSKPEDIAVLANIFNQTPLEIKSELVFFENRCLKNSAFNQNLRWSAVKLKSNSQENFLNYLLSLHVPVDKEDSQYHFDQAYGFFSHTHTEKQVSWEREKYQSLEASYRSNNLDALVQQIKTLLKKRIASIADSSSAQEVAALKDLKSSIEGSISSISAIQEKVQSMRGRFSVEGERHMSKAQCLLAVIESFLNDKLSMSMALK